MTDLDAMLHPLPEGTLVHWSTTERYRVLISYTEQRRVVDFNSWTVRQIRTRAGKSVSGGNIEARELAPDDRLLTNSVLEVRRSVVPKRVPDWITHLPGGSILEGWFMMRDQWTKGQRTRRRDDEESSEFVAVIK